MPRDVKEFAGERPIFIDANIFLHHAFGTNSASTAFLKRVEEENIKAYTSALVMEEVFFKLMIQSASNFVDKITLEKLKSTFADEKNREKILEPVEQYLSYVRMLGDMGLRIVDLTASDITRSVEKVKEHGLITADAAHLSVMERKGIRDIVTNDQDFIAIKEINVWMPATT
jgi:predicted nucleic acid-binding protein